MQHSPAWALTTRALLGEQWEGWSSWMALGSGSRMLGRLLGHSGAWTSYQDAVPSYLFSPLHSQLPGHAEFLPVVFPAAGLGGVCVCDLRLCEGESPSHASQWQRPLLRPEHHTWPREWTWEYMVLVHNWH